MAAISQIVLIMEYNGRRYYGSQLQAGLPTIQGETEEALLRLTGEKSRILMASRTDTGVHAQGQVASFRTRSPLPVKAYVSGLNHYLPQDIAVKMACTMDKTFNVRRDAESREYGYYILNRKTRSPLKEGFAYRVPACLDAEAMNKACGALVGVHDFASFATELPPGTKSTVRRVFQAEVTRNNEMVIFKIVASSFLPHQVRNTAGALIRVGRGKMSVDEFRSLLAARQPGLARPTAPPCGLCLVRVNYPCSFGEMN